jgi:uncharacterized protein involved in outer membrane biogenesis
MFYNDINISDSIRKGVMSRKKLLLLSLPLGFLCVLLVVIFLAVIFFPTEKIRKLAETKASEAFQRPVSIGNIGLSFFGIPALKMSDIRIGPSQEEEASLAEIKSVRIRVNLFKLITRTVEIVSVDFDRPAVTIVIPKTDSRTAQLKQERKSPLNTPKLPFPVTLRSLRIKNGSVEIINNRAATRLYLKNITQKLYLNISGDMKALDSNGLLIIDDSMFASGTVKKPLTGIRLEFAHQLTGDVTSGDFTLKKGNLRLNDLPLAVTAEITQWKTIHFTVVSEKTDAEKIFRAIPSSMFSGKDTIRAQGFFTLSISGVADTAAEKPMISFNGSVDMGPVRFSYDGLPAGTNEITTRTEFSEKFLNIKELIIKTGKSNIALSGMVQSYMSKPDLSVQAVGTIDLKEAAMPLPLLTKNNISGLVDMNLTIKGAPSKPRSLAADGVLSLKELVFELPETLKNPVHLNGIVKVSPAALFMDTIAVKSGESDFALKGEIRDYLSLAFPDSSSRPSLQGTLISTMIDVNDLILITKDSNIEFLKPWHLEKTLKKMPVPPNLSMEMSVKLGKVIFGRLKSDGTSAAAAYSGGILKLMNLNISAYNGYLTGAAEVDFSDTSHVTYTTNLKLDDFDSGLFISDFFGVGNFFRGKLSSSLNVTSSGLDSLSMLKNLAGEGSMLFEKGQIDNWEFAKKLGDYLKFLDFDHLDFDTITNAFFIKDQKVLTPDMAIKTAYGNILMDGACGFDTSLDYTMRLQLNKEGTKRAVQQLSALTQIVSKELDSLELTVDIGGTISSPTFKLNTAKVKEQVKDELRSRADKLIEEKIYDENLKKEGKKLLNKLLKKEK